MSRTSGPRSSDLIPADLLVAQACLAAGGAPADALREVGGAVLQPVLAALAAGRGLPGIAAEIDEAATGPVPDGIALPPAAAALVRALAVAEVVGAPSGPSVQGVLDRVRGGMRLQQVIRIRSAQATTSARFLVGLPVVGGVVLAALDPAARTFLASPLGLVVVLLAAVLIAVAAGWIRRLLRRIPDAGSRVDPLVGSGHGGRDPVWVVAGLLGLGTLLLLGPAAALVAVGVLRLFGPGLLRRVRAAAIVDPGPDGTGPGRPTADPITPSAPGGLPTVEGLDLLALALQAGIGLTEACRLVATLGPAPLRSAVADVAARLAHGAGPNQAFPAQLAELAHLIDITSRWGAPTAEALRLLAGDLRDRAAASAEEAAERLTVQLVFPTTLLLVPAFGLLVVTPLVASSLSGLRLIP